MFLPNIRKEVRGLFIRDIETICKSVVGGIIAILSIAIHHPGLPFIALLWAMVIDIITGTVVAIEKKRLRKIVAYWGVFNKSGIICLIAFGEILYHIGGVSQPVGTWLSSFFLAYEGISILGNTKKLGVPVPTFLQKILDAIQIEEENKIERYLKEKTDKDSYEKTPYTK